MSDYIKKPVSFTMEIRVGDKYYTHAGEVPILLHSHPDDDEVNPWELFKHGELYQAVGWMEREAKLEGRESYAADLAEGRVDRAIDAGGRE